MVLKYSEKQFSVFMVIGGWILVQLYVVYCLKHNNVCTGDGTVLFPEEIICEKGCAKVCTVMLQPVYR